MHFLHTALETINFFDADYTQEGLELMIQNVQLFHRDHFKRRKRKLSARVSECHKLKTVGR